jgi:hypothetical protein
MLICVLKSTGAILEMQSDATTGTLIKNSIKSGFNERDLIEEKVTAEEYKTRIELQNPPKEHKMDLQKQIDALKNALIAKGVITNEEVTAKEE